MARPSSIKIDRCPAGCFHVHIGPVSLRLSPDELSRFAREVWRALEEHDRTLPDSIDEHGTFHRSLGVDAAPSKEGCDS
ncbi:MAG: hypothetical protein RL885_18580 [Planctomycetota bacterium]